MSIEALAAAMLALVTLRVGVPADHIRNHPNGVTAYTEEVATAILAAASHYHIDPLLLAAVAINESALNPNAVGSFDEFGIFQLNPRRRDVRGDESLREQAYLAAAILHRSLLRCEDTDAALRMYNAGRCENGSRYSRNVERKRERLREALRSTR